MVGSFVGPFGRFYINCIMVGLWGIMPMEMPKDMLFEEFAKRSSLVVITHAISYGGLKTKAARGVHTSGLSMLLYLNLKNAGSCLDLAGRRNAALCSSKWSCLVCLTGDDACAGRGRNGPIEITTVNSEERRAREERFCQGISLA